MTTQVDPCGDLCRIMQPHADVVYRERFPGCTIQRLKGKKPGQAHVLDRYFGIDVILRTANGMRLTIQEKARTAENYYKYGQFTLEYYNNPETEHEGEWFYLCADLYFYGYAKQKQSGWLDWHLFTVPPFKLAVVSGLFEPDGLQVNDQFSTASFYWWSWRRFPARWMIANMHEKAKWTPPQLAPAH